MGDQDSPDIDSTTTSESHKLESVVPLSPPVIPEGTHFTGATKERVGMFPSGPKMPH